MPVIHERFEYGGKVYCTIHFKISPRKFIVRLYQDGQDIDRASYDNMRLVYKKALSRFN